jgi:hypothetical protein
MTRTASYSRALERKEVAPPPRKSLARRLLGPLYPGRKFWVMPADDAHGPGEVQTVRWPWIFWAVVLVLLGIGGYFGWSMAMGPEATVT